MDMTSVSELLPKKHINADAFAESNPTADGSTTVIAIWDTGVDPTAGGLQVTPDGKPKIIDFIDASGCGDVKMRTKFRLSGSERTVKSLTGRQIMIPTHWKPKNGEIRMGVKLASELFPRALLQRLRNENKDDVWSPCVKRLASHIAGDFSNAEEQLTESYESRWRTLSLDTHPGPVNQENQHTVSSETRSTQNLSVKDDTEGLDCVPSPARRTCGRRKSMPKGKLNESEATVSPLSTSKDQLKSAARLLEDALVTFDRHYVAPEMVYDCFVFHDGAQWLACVDTSPYNPGKTLADMPLLADYSVGHQCACFGDDTQLFFTVKILNEGKLLQIVTNDSEHGTHVAAMAAAFFPSTQSDQLSTGSVESTLLKRNGVAPGAQIVSIKISDSRLGSMETGVSLLRAIRWTVKLKCDVVNYSFGEHCVWPNVGRLSKHLNELVNTYGIVMVASGGNNGPGLGTVGSPGSSVDALIGVAPLVFPDMMRVLYSQPYLSPCDVLTYGDSMDRGLTVDTESSGPSNNCPRPFGRAAPTAYTWGSRGPALDGSLGLCVAAPGAANTSVASWKLRPSALLNGSSMSAPLVTGCVALLLSGLRHRWSRSGNSVDPTAYRIPPTLVRLAIMNTACPVPHLSSLDQGHGVIQVDKAFNYLLKAIDRGCGSGSPSAADRYTSQHSTNCVDPNPQCVDCGGMTQFPNCVEKAPHSDCEQEKNHVLPAIFPSSGLFGWRVRCTVTGPGCVYQDQGIWIRRGWFPRSSIGAVHAIRHRLPVLRYTVHISIDFDKSVPLETRRRLELHLISAVYMNHSADPIPMPSNKPTWLQIAQLISVTSLGRDVSLVIDPNQFVHSTVGSTNGTEHGRHSPAELVSGIPVAPCHRVERKGMNHDWHSNSASSFCWPSSLSTSQHMTPVMSTEPQITMLGFFDSHQPHLGPLARIPITIHNPISLSALSSIGNPKITFCDTFDSLHKVRRWFVEVPTGSTAGVIRLARLDENDAACEFKVTVCMPQPRSGLTTGQQETTWPLVCLSRCGRNCIVPGRARSANRRSADDFDGAVQLAFPIPWEADYLELTVAQHWGLEQPATVIGDLYFRGLQPSVPQLSMNSSDHYIRMVLRSNFSTEEILPSISLTHWVLPLRPKESKISYLGHGEEEVLVNQTGCYALRLVYQFTCPFKSSVSQFELPWLQELLYDSDYLVQLYHLYDWRGRFIGAGDYDLKSAKKPKFTFNLERGDYKVVVQICHEQGASLGSSHSKLGDSERDGVRPVEQSNRSTLSPSSVSTAVGSTGSDQQGPLERIRHHPALIRFRLPSPGIANQSSVQPSGHPVTFEFSAFAFSLGLNGTKPCSALDPIPYERCMNGTNNELGYSMDTNPLQENRRGELNRRCLCLPTNLAAKESTSLFIGLTDERYPSYAVRGSYFAGSISFYNSDVLQGVVNYPFRLVIDSDLMGSDNLSQSRKDEPESSGSCLCVDSMGISVEDFSWLRPLSDCICLIRSHGLSFEVDQSDLLAQSKLLDFGSSVRDTDPENIGKEGVSRAKHLHLDEFSNETTLLCDASELGMQPVEELTRADSPGNERNEMGSNGKVNALSVEITNDCSTKKEVPLDQDSSIDHLSKEPTPEVISTNTTEQRPRSAPSPTVSEVGLDKCRNSLKINNGGPPTPAAEIPLSRRLAHIHERLTRIDAPCSTTCATWSDMVQLQSRRRQVWSLAERIIFGHSLDDSFAQQPGAVENNGTDQLPRSRDDQNPSSNDNFFHHLLTVRVVSAPRSSTHQSDQLTTGMRTTEEVSPADCTVRNSHMSRSDPELNREPSEVISHHLTASMSTTKQSSAECIQLPSESVGVKKKSSKKDGPVHNYLELKLRLVDILARFGRLLCERVLLTRFSCCQYNSVPAKNVTGSHDLSRDPIRSGWTLTEWLLRNLDSQAIAPSSIYKSSTPEKDRFFDDRITRTYLPQIHARLIQLTTTTAVSSSSVGDRVEIGAHALPAWMLASGVRELCASVDMEQSGIGNPSMQIGGGSWNHGSVGGRLVLFFLLYHIVQERYAQALRLLSRITYQIEEPPTGAFRGLIPCGSTPSLGPLRSVHSTPINSLLTAKHSHHWLIWILDRIGWKEVATYMEQRAPIIFPENDYSLMADFH